MTTSVEAKAALATAARELAELHRGYRAAQDALADEWGPKISAAKSTLDRATDEHARAVAAETSDHPLHGRRVFRMEPQLAKYTYRKIGEKRVDGIIETYRPGVDLGRGYSKAGGLSPGDPFVRLLKKDGKPGTSTQPYQTRWDNEARWTLVEETPANA